MVSFAGISAKVEKVVIVFTQIAAIQVDRLPKSTFGKDMAIEARAGWFGWGWPVPDCLIAHSDGTNKHGSSYTMFDIANQEGKLLICGIRKFGAADAQSQLDLFCEILGDICSSLENKDEVINKTF